MPFRSVRLYIAALRQRFETRIATQTVEMGIEAHEGGR